MTPMTRSTHCLVALALTSASPWGCAVIRTVEPAPPPPGPVPRTYYQAVEPTTLPEQPAPRSTPPPPPPREPERAALDLGAPWWGEFGDPVLDATIQEALDRNWDIRELVHRYRELQLDPTIPWSWWWPLQVDVPVGAQAQGVSFPGAFGNDPYMLDTNPFSFGVTASYELDVFAKLYARRQVGRANQALGLEFAQVTVQDVVVGIVEGWFQILEQRALVQLQRELITLNEKLLELVRSRFEQQLASRLALLQQEQQLVLTKSQLPTLEAQAAALENNLTRLLGRAPVGATSAVPAKAELPELPPLPDIGSPEDLIENRPEVRLEMVRVAEAEHRINANLSEWFPSLRLLAQVGRQTWDYDRFFTTYSLGAVLTWNIFDGGRRLLDREQIEVLRSRRRGTYQQAVELAILRVQNALVQESSQAASLAQLRANVEVGRRLLDEAQQLFAAGLSDYLPVVTAVANLASARRSEIQAHRQLLVFRVQLHRALGGTWSAAIVERPKDVR